MKNLKKTNYLKLPFQFDEAKLKQDLSKVLDSKWNLHFNTNGYKGEWKAISLYLHNGEESYISALTSENSIISDSPMLEDCQYFKEVIESVKCPKMTARLLRLDVGGEIKPHTDFELGYEDNCFRLHVPIITNKDVQFILNDTELTMLPGECWYTNVNCVHSVKNSGDIDRIHLVLDFERNDWSDELFFSLAPKESFEPALKENEPKETLLRMIEELKQRKEPASDALIKEIELKLNEGGDR